MASSWMRRASRSAFGFAGRKTGTGPFSGIMATLSFLRRIGVNPNGGVAELAYAADLKSAAARLVGSSPTAPTRYFANQAPYASANSYHFVACASFKIAFPWILTVCFVASSESSALLQERPKGASPSLKTLREKQCAPSALMLVSSFRSTLRIVAANSSKMNADVAQRSHNLAQKRRWLVFDLEFLG